VVGFMKTYSPTRGSPSNIARKVGVRGTFLSDTSEFFAFLVLRIT